MSSKKGKKLLDEGGRRVTSGLRVDGVAFLF